VGSEGTGQDHVEVTIIKVAGPYLRKKLKPPKQKKARQQWESALLVGDEINGTCEVYGISFA
jgi:hypothetical protein